MFSHLRPNNRRSANPLPTTRPQTSSSRYYHESSTVPAYSFDLPPPRTAQSLSFSQSPVSSEPPTLPPIPRVASQHEPRIEDDWQAKEQEQVFPSYKERRLMQEDMIPNGPAPSKGNIYPPSKSEKDQPRTISQENDTPLPSGSSEQARPAPSRRKRPIDIAYESMRSYSEPARRQSFGTYPENPQFIPQPLRQPPPPPPKPSQFPSQPQRPAPPPPVKPSQQVPSTSSQKSHGKTKLNLLNPMSLLARRRSSQAVAEAYSQNQAALGLRLPDDYDPRIRGKVVHDFSAPRPTRPLSSNDPGASGSQSKDGEASSEGERARSHHNEGAALDIETVSTSSPEKEHTPVFKENFDESVDSWSTEMGNPAKEKASAFMYQVSLQASKPDPSPASLPAFARNLPSNISSNNDAVRKVSSPPKAPLTMVLETPSPHQKSARSSPPTSPPSVRSRATSISDPSYNAQVPQRYKSNSSRFSFDLAGVGSAAQEKLLEEKHRDQAKRKERESVVSGYSQMHDDEEYAEYDNMMDDGGLEERIPGVNADADDFDMPGSHHAMEGFNFISPNKSSFESAASQVSTGLTSPDTPRDSQGQIVGFALSKQLPELPQFEAQGLRISPKMGDAQSKSTLDAATNSGDQSRLPQREVASESYLADIPQRLEVQDDDLYFDDGMIEDVVEEETHAFDESVFDDDSSRIYGLPLRDLKPIPGVMASSNTNITEPKDEGNGAEILNQCDRAELASSTHDSSDGEDSAIAEMRDSVADLNQRARTTSFAGLTQDNLGLHDRLAFAANQAAIEGRFNRSYSQGSAQESHDGFDPSRATSSNERQLSQQLEGLRFGNMANDTNDLAFDDVAFTEAEDDDPLIAAANAEALENDDNGFYGQEFGFYARATGSSESEYVNGGYFGPRAIEGVHRMNSGRDNFQEPSLTPITERSEWSNRNSTISLAMHGFPLSAQFPSNPQLADLMRVQEGEEMSLESLRKLRRGAWGGSDASLQSSSNSPNSGSPLTYFPSGLMGPPVLQPSNSNNTIAINPSSQNLAGSFHSLPSSNGHPSSNSDASPSSDSPTVTLASTQVAFLIPPQPMGPPPPPPTDPSSSPVRRNAASKPWAPGHSRHSSGAESVSYREEGGMWFCEKTRISAETGEVEVLGRSLVEGGRI